MATGNDFLLDAAAAEPRFIPLASVHPDMGAAAAVDELERVKARGARGVKLHPDFQRFIVDREDMFPVYEACAALGLRFCSMWATRTATRPRLRACGTSPSACPR